MKHFQLEGQQVPLPEAIIFGKTAAMELVRQKVDRLAGTNTPVLIQGESGTGKEVLAALIHAQSGPACGPFLKITCPAIAPSTPENQRTEEETSDSNGAQAVHTEWGDLATGGTLLFDEISELHPSLQPKLLQFMQDGRFDWIRNDEDRKAEIQVICTTNRDLEAEIEAGRFRRDLLYRINVFTIDMLPLRHRTEDIPDMVEHLLRCYYAKHHVPPRMISPQLLELMQRYNWPGNIRELENLIRRYVILGSEQVIGSELLAKLSTDFHPEENYESISLKKLTRRAAFELERRVILKALENHGWNRMQAARSLNISYRALLYKIKQGGMPPKRSKGSRTPLPVLAEDK